MSHTDSSPPATPDLDTPDQETTVRVRSADLDIARLADHITRLLTDHDPVLVDLSQHRHHGDHVLLRIHRHHAST